MHCFILLALIGTALSAPCVLNSASSYSSLSKTIKIAAPCQQVRVPCQQIRRIPCQQIRRIPCSTNVSPCVRRVSLPCAQRQVIKSPCVAYQKPCGLNRADILKKFNIQRPCSDDPIVGRSPENGDPTITIPETGFPIIEILPEGGYPTYGGPDYAAYSAEDDTPCSDDPIVGRSPETGIPTIINPETGFPIIEILPEGGYPTDEGPVYAAYSAEDDTPCSDDPIVGRSPETGIPTITIPETGFPIIEILPEGGDPTDGGPVYAGYSAEDDTPCSDDPIVGRSPETGIPTITIPETGFPIIEILPEGGIPTNGGNPVVLAASRPESGIPNIDFAPDGIPTIDVGPQNGFPTDGGSAPVFAGYTADGDDSTPCAGFFGQKISISASASASASASTNC